MATKSNITQSTQGLPAGTVPAEQLPLSRQQRISCPLLASHAAFADYGQHATAFEGLHPCCCCIPTVDPSLSPAVCCCCFCSSRACPDLFSPRQAQAQTTSRSSKSGYKGPHGVLLPSLCHLWAMQQRLCSLVFQPAGPPCPSSFSNALMSLLA